MKHPAFESLQRCLDSTESWLDQHFAGATGTEAKVRDKLARYIRHCRRRGDKWTKPSEARKSVEKIRRAIVALMMLKYEDTLDQ